MTQTLTDNKIFEIQEIEAEGGYGKYAISPLEQGYGHTLGNSLRRVLLRSLKGFAIVSLEIDGVKHQFSTLSGMKEDVVELVLNLKNVRFIKKGKDEIEGVETGKIAVKGPSSVVAGDIKLPATLEVVNPDLVLANLNKGAKLEAQLKVASGVGYSPHTDREERGVGIIPMDAIFSPVLRVNYKVEETRVGRVTDFDKLIIEIWTDGTITPKDALVKASEILISYLSQIVAPQAVVKPSEKKEEVNPNNRLSVEEIGLPTRVANALVRSGYESVADLLKAKKDDIAKIRNLGEKSIKIISAALMEKNIKFPSEG